MRRMLCALGSAIKSLAYPALISLAAAAVVYGMVLHPVANGQGVSEWAARLMVACAVVGLANIVHTLFWIAYSLVLIIRAAKRK